MTDIKTLNDNLRQTFCGGKVMLTQGISFKPTLEKAEIMEKSDILTILQKIMIRMKNMILAVLIIKAKKSFGKSIIMTKILLSVRGS